MQIKPNILWENIVTKAFVGDLAEASVNNQYNKKRTVSFNIAWKLCKRHFRKRESNLNQCSLLYDIFPLKCTRWNENTYTHIGLSYAGGTQRLPDSTADKTGGSSSVLSRAKAERSWPDGSVDHASSLPQSVWLQPLSQQCALSSLKVMVHANVFK